MPRYRAPYIGNTDEKHFIARVVALLLVFVSVSAAQMDRSDGTIVESVPCAAALKRTYEQYRADVRKRSEEEVAEAAREGIKWDQWYERLAVTLGGKVFLRQVFPTSQGKQTDIFKGS